MKAFIVFTLTFIFFIITVRAQAPSTLTIAVSDLSAQGLKESEAAVITEQLRVELMKSPHIRLIERNQMKEILKEQGFQQTGCTNDACAVEVGQLLGVKNIVVGTVGMVGSYTVISARLIDVSTGQVIVNESVRTKGGVDVMLEKGIQTIARRMVGILFPIADSADSGSHRSKNTRLKKGLFIGVGSALLVGGGVTALLYLRNDADPQDAGVPNTRIEFP